MCERRVAEYEEELSPTKEKNERQHRLEAVLNKHQVVLHRPDARQLIGHQEEGLPQPQGRSFTLKQEDPQPPHLHTEKEESKPPHVNQEQEAPQTPHIKKEEEELWITQEEACLLGQEEADLTKFPLTVVSVKTEDHEEKPPESSQLHHSPNVQQLIGYQEEPLLQLKEEPQSPHIKAEEEELWISQKEECLPGQEEADLTKFHLTVVSVKTEDHEEKPPESSQLHHSPRVSEEHLLPKPQEEPQPRHIKEENEPQSTHIKDEKEEPQPLHMKEEEHSISRDGEHLEGQEEFPLINVPFKGEDDKVKGESEEKREAEPPSSSSTEADGDHCGLSQADKLLAPLSDSDDTTSHSPDTDDTHLKCSHFNNCLLEVHGTHPETSEK
nr:involucrin-like [Nerophis lumbriciformis]